MSGSLKLLDKGAESWKKMQIHRHWGPGALDERPGMPLCSDCLWIGKPQHLPTSPNMQLLNPSICTSLHWFRRLCRSLCCLELCWSMIGRCNPRTTLEDVIGDLGWNYDTPQTQTINKGSQTNSKPQTTVPATVLRCVSTWILFHKQGQRGWLPWRF